jgi:hypothetical protein
MPLPADFETRLWGHRGADARPVGDDPRRCESRGLRAAQGGREAAPHWPWRGRRRAEEEDLAEREAKTLRRELNEQYRLITLDSRLDRIADATLSVNSRGVPREKKRAPILLPPDAGRAYAMGPVHTVFKADGDETRGRYSISEWWLEPYTRGPGAHTH